MALFYVCCRYSSMLVASTQNSPATRRTGFPCSFCLALLKSFFFIQQDCFEMFSFFNHCFTSFLRTYCSTASSERSNWRRFFSTSRENVLAAFPNGYDTSKNDTSHVTWQDGQCSVPVRKLQTGLFPSCVQVLRFGIAAQIWTLQRQCPTHHTPASVQPAPFPGLHQQMAIHCLLKLKPNNAIHRTRIMCVSEPIPHSNSVPPCTYAPTSAWDQLSEWPRTQTYSACALRHVLVPTNIYMTLLVFFKQELIRTYL